MHLSIVESCSCMEKSRLEHGAGCRDEHARRLYSASVAGGMLDILPRVSDAASGPGIAGKGQ